MINNDCFGRGVRYFVRDATCGFSSNVPALVPSLEVLELFFAFDKRIYFLVIFRLVSENVVFGAGNPLAVRHFDSSLSSDSPEDSEDIHYDYDVYHDIVNLLECSRLPRSCLTYAHDGDMLWNLDGMSLGASYKALE